MTRSGAACSVGEATALILDGAAPLDTETVPYRALHGRVLGAAVRSPRDLPPWRNASMDGYAVRAADVAGASATVPRSLRVVESIGAGALPTRAISEGEAARIMTGAPVPDGADSVIRIEDTDRGAATVRVMHARDAGMNVRPQGEDLASGAIALEAGHEIDAAALGVLASIGAVEIPVFRRPRLALLSMGNELLPLTRHDQAVTEQRIVDVNTHTIGAMAAMAGAMVQPLPLAPDDPAAIRAAIEHSPPFDVLVTSGGVSAGDHDHTRAVLRELGAEILIDRVRIRPGAPLGFGRLGDARWIGLPGNPVSAMVTFELFVRPLLRRLAGHGALFRQTVPARTGTPVRTAAALTHFLRAVVTPGDDGIWNAVLTGPQGSGLITSMARANALLIVPESQREVAPGTVLRAMLLGDRALHSPTQAA